MKGSSWNEHVNSWYTFHRERLYQYAKGGGRKHLPINEKIKVFTTNKQISPFSFRFISTIKYISK